MPQLNTRSILEAAASPQPILVGGAFNNNSDPVRFPAGTEITVLQTESNTYSDKYLRRAKEAISGLIGITLIVCLVVMLIKAIGVLGNDQSDLAFQRIKDLLLFINPLVGVVLGYYFNRVITEPRAENAERMAQQATTTAQQAQAAQGQAEARAQINKSEANEAKTVLREIVPAADKLLSQMPLTAAPMALGSAAGAGPASIPESMAEARFSLQKSLERARAITR